MDCENLVIYLYLLSLEFWDSNKYTEMEVSRGQILFDVLTTEQDTLFLYLDVGQ